MIGLIGSMKIEIDGIIDRMEEKEETVISGITFAKGLVSGAETVVAICGTGKVSASVCTQTMIMKYAPDVIINTGVAGSLSENLHIGDIAISESMVQHDVDISELGYALGYLCELELVYLPVDPKAKKIMVECVEKAGVNYEIGVIASGDQFISAQAKKDAIKSNFNAIACEMEGGSIAQTCYMNQTPFCIIRAISDEANGEASIDYTIFASKAAKNAINITLEFIKKFNAENSEQE